MVAAVRLATMPLLLAQEVREVGSRRLVEPELLQRLRAAALALLQPLTVDAGRTLWRRLELRSLLNTAAVPVAVTRTYPRMALGADHSLVDVEAGLVAARRSLLQQSTRRLAVLPLLLVAVVVLPELRVRLLLLELLALTAEFIEAAKVVVVVVERSQRQLTARLVVREDSRLVEAEAAELVRIQARAVLVELAAVVRSTF